MKRGIYILLPIALLAAGCTLFRTESPARPVSLDKKTAEKVIGEIEKDRADNNEWLRSSATSYLAAIDRVDFGAGKTINVGRAPDNDVQLSTSDIEPHHLRVTVEGDHFRIECMDANARFRIGEEIKKQATVGPSYLQAGRYTLRLSHQNFPAIIVFDPQSPRFKEYKGLAYFPIDLSYRYELPLKHYPKREKITIGSTRGNQRNAELVGWVDFMAGNAQCRLEATRLIEPGVPGDEVQIFFRDASSRTESYPLGRYVDLKKLENGNYLLDFNLAYNPACAFSNYYNCPIPPQENRLGVAIRAGEKNPHYH